MHQQKEACVVTLAWGELQKQMLGKMCLMSGHFEL